MFYLLIFLLFLAGLTGGGIPIREYKLPNLETGAKISSLFIASLLLFIHQKFYNTVSFKISNKVSESEESSIKRIDISTINIDGKDLEITNKINEFGYTSKKFNVSTSGIYDYLIEFYITDEQGQVYPGRSEDYIFIESGDVFDIQIDLNSIEPELELVERD